MGNGYCNDETNIPECSFDGGDCCGPCISMDFCTNCSCNSNNINNAISNAHIGNGFCDKDLNTPECNFDGGDCCGQCEMISVSLKTSEYHQSNYEEYYFKSSLINGKPSWISSSSKAIWYLQEYNGWNFGKLESIGTSYITIYSEKVTYECPFDVPAEKWWYYYEGKWNNAVGNEVMVQCIKGIHSKLFLIDSLRT